MAQSLRIALGADHGGFDLKQQLVVYLQGQGHQIRDCGTNSTEAVDYPVFAEAVARLVGSGACDFGIVVDGAGIGSAMAANKVPGVLAAACYNETLARNSREHNDANVLTLGAGQVTADQAKAIVDVFLATACTAKRHRRRVDMIRDIERKALMAGGIRRQRGSLGRRPSAHRRPRAAVAPGEPAAGSARAAAGLAPTTSPG